MIARIDRDQVEQQRSRDEASLAASAIAVSAIGNLGSMATDDARKRHCAPPGRNCVPRRRNSAQLVAGSRPQEIQEARAAVADAKAQHDQAKSDWDRVQDLIEERRHFAASNTINTACELDSTAAVLRQADERLALVVEGPRKEDIDAARAEVARAEAALRCQPRQRAGIEAPRTGPA